MLKRNPGGFSRPFLPSIGHDGIWNERNKFYVSWLFTYWKDERASLKTLKISFEQNQSQIFIETPYRNNKLLEDLLQTLHPETHLCITNILPTEYIKTKKIAAWKRNYWFT
jgi:16S rRNA C1402 (ribose-2'-O) methylase RsmI